MGGAWPGGGLRWETAQLFGGSPNLFRDDQEPGAQVPILVHSERPVQLLPENYKTRVRMLGEDLTAVVGGGGDGEQCSNT